MQPLDPTEQAAVARLLAEEALPIPSPDSAVAAAATSTPAVAAPSTQSISRNNGRFLKLETDGWHSYEFWPILSASGSVVRFRRVRTEDWSTSEVEIEATPTDAQCEASLCEYLRWVIDTGTDPLTEFNVPQVQSAVKVWILQFNTLAPSPFGNVRLTRVRRNGQESFMKPDFLVTDARRIIFDGVPEAAAKHHYLGNLDPAELERRFRNLPGFLGLRFIETSFAELKITVDEYVNGVRPEDVQRQLRAYAQEELAAIAAIEGGLEANTHQEIRGEALAAAE